MDEWSARRSELPREAGRIMDEVAAAAEAQRVHELVPFTGQTAGLIHAILTAEEIIRSVVAGAEEALRATAAATV